MPRYTKFGSPFKTPPLPESRVEIIDPTKGMHAGFSPQELPPGYTPDSQNFVVQDGSITPRSGLSRYDSTFSLGDAARGAFEFVDTAGQRYVFGASHTTFGVLASDAPSWNTLLYSASSPEGASPSGDWTDRWQGASIYCSAIDANVAVFTNGRDLPKYAVLQPSLATFSDFTWVSSLISRAVSACAFDNRLVFFDVGDSTYSEPQRAVWSDRGDPLSYPATNYADLLDMAGTGQVVVAEKDGIVLFSDREIWRGQRRTDIYAFDFYPVFKSFGCPFPRTIVSTPLGIIFLGADFEVYLLNGTQVLALGPTTPQPVGAPQPQNPSRIQQHLSKRIHKAEMALSAYDPFNRVYALFYCTGDDIFPTDALFYHLNNGACFRQKLSLGVSCAVDAEDREEDITFDSISPAYTWGDYDVMLDDATLSPAPRRLQVWSADGTPYRFHSAQTSDDGTAIDARWRSHALGQSDQFRYETLWEIGVEHATPSACSLGLHTSSDMGATFGSAYTRSLSSTSAGNAILPAYETASSPLFEVRVVDGGRPRIARLQARLRDAGLYGGAL